MTSITPHRYRIVPPIDSRIVLREPRMTQNDRCQRRVHEEECYSLGVVARRDEGNGFSGMRNTGKLLSIESIDSYLVSEGGGRNVEVVSQF